MKWSGFGLRRRCGSKHFRRSGLVVPDVTSSGGVDVRSDGFEEAESAGCNDIGGVIGDFEGNGYVRLGGEIVYLVGENCVEPTAKRRGVAEVGVVELHASLVGVVWVDVDVVDALSVEVG